MKSNVTIIRLNNGGEYLQSYNTVVCYRPPKHQVPFIISEGQPQSQTTAKHINKFLGMPYKEALKSGRAMYGNIPAI